MGVKAGVEPLALWEAVRQGAGGRRRTFDGLVDQFLPNKYDPPAFALRLAHKDVTLATQLGRELKVPMHMANLALDELTAALNRGWENRDRASRCCSSSNAAASGLRSTPSAFKRFSTAIRPSMAVPSAVNACEQFGGT